MKYFLRPFTYIAGTKALLLGWTIMIITALIAWQSGTHFDGVVDAHMAQGKATVWMHFIEALIDWLCMTLFFYTAGRISSRSDIRFIDVAGTMVLARAPMFFVAFLGFLPLPQVPPMENMNSMVIIVGLIAMVFVIWMIAWMFQAYVISCNVKGTKAVISFIITLLLAEAVSVSIIRSIY